MKRKRNIRRAIKFSGCKENWERLSGDDLDRVVFDENDADDDHIYAGNILIRWKPRSNDEEEHYPPDDPIRYDDIPVPIIYGP